MEEMVVLRLSTKVKQESSPYPDRGEVSEDYILVKVRFSRAIGSRSSLDYPVIWEERTLLDSRQFWVKLRSVQNVSSPYRTRCAQSITESLSLMRVPEEEHPNAINKLLEVLDATVSTELPIDVAIWDMTFLFGSDAVSEAMDMYKPNLVPATRSSIEALERVNVDHTLPYEDPCVICLEDFSVDQMVIHLPCSHYYHEHCIVRSLEISHMCPLCRYPMPILVEEVPPQPC
ncbi:putative chromatin regulator PHD family [Rosa chinensis]|uniref:RING-type E3 ubiquitin transferase n=1 Tax=Rosa chinensis TaxID=74649 RepID=A0A2P6RFR1_ROSCH|nr:putative chromatin regulator PHD family [Rosa chinensis]